MIMEGQVFCMFVEVAQPAMSSLPSSLPPSLPLSLKRGKERVKEREGGGKRERESAARSRERPGHKRRGACT